MFKIVILVTLSVLCVVHTQGDDGCRHSRSYTRVKRGKYPGPPIRFYSRPPVSFPIRGPYSYTPPPFMQDDEPPYPGSRPYKVSKRPTNEALGDDDINNLVKNLSKQDLDKIIAFAEKDKYFDKNNDIMDYDNNRPHKRENSRPTYTKEFYKGNTDIKYQEEKPYEVEFKKYVNYVTAATPINFAPQDDRRNQYFIDSEPSHVNRPLRDYTYRPTDEQPSEFQGFSPQDGRLTQFKPLQGAQKPEFVTDDSLTRQNIGSPEVLSTYPEGSSNIPETAEEEKLPPPVNMRVEDFDVSFTNNVPTVVNADSSSYKVENFGELPLMNYHDSKLHSVSSYHVPHYTVTQSKSQSLPSPPVSTSYASSQSYSSSSLLKPSPAAASVRAPPVEPAPPPSAAKEQSDAHLKATKIWSHRSKGAAYTLHDDGTLTPEWPRPKYG